MGNWYISIERRWAFLPPAVAARKRGERRPKSCDTPFFSSAVCPTMFIHCSLVTLATGCGEVCFRITADNSAMSVMLMIVPPCLPTIGTRRQLWVGESEEGRGNPITRRSCPIGQEAQFLVVMGGEKGKEKSHPPSYLPFFLKEGEINYF